MLLKLNLINLIASSIYRDKDRFIDRVRLLNVKIVGTKLIINSIKNT